MFDKSPFKSIIADIRSNLPKRGYKLIKSGFEYVEEMKDLTYSQVKRFREKLIRFNIDLIKKNKVKKDFDQYYEKHKIKTVKDVKYFSDNFAHENIRCLFNGFDYIDIKSYEIDFIAIKSNEIKSYEAKPYEVEYCEVKPCKIKSYEIDYIDIKPNKIKSYEVDCMDIKPYEINYIDIKPQEIKCYEVEYCEVKSRKIKSYEIDYIDIKSNEDYYIKNIKNEFNKLSNNLVEANTKDVRYLVDHINNGENLKETPINLEDIKDKFIAYNDILPIGILSKSSYIDLRKMNTVSSVTFDDEYKTLETKALTSLKMPWFLGFFKYVSEEELSEETLLEYIELNKNKVQNVWIDEYKKYLKELDDGKCMTRKCMTKREIRMKIKELKSEKEDKIDLLEWKLRIEKISIKDDNVDEYFQKM